MLGSGLQELTNTFLGESVTLFKQQAAEMGNAIKQRSTAIDLQKQEVNNAVSAKDEQAEVNRLKEQRKAMQNASDAKNKKDKAEAKVKKDEKTIEKFIDEYNNGYQIVCGVRNDRKTDSFFKK